MRQQASGCVKVRLRRGQPALCRAVVPALAALPLVGAVARSNLRRPDRALDSFQPVKRSNNTARIALTIGCAAIQRPTRQDRSARRAANFVLKRSFAELVIGAARALGRLVDALKTQAQVRAGHRFMDPRYPRTGTTPLQMLKASRQTISSRPPASCQTRRCTPKSLVHGELGTMLRYVAISIPRFTAIPPLSRHVLPFWAHGSSLCRDGNRIVAHTPRRTNPTGRLHKYSGAGDLRKG